MSSCKVLIRETLGVHSFIVSAVLIVRLLFRVRKGLEYTCMCCIM